MVWKADVVKFAFEIPAVQQSLELATPAFYNFGDRCGWMNKPLTDCHKTIKLDGDATNWSVACATPSTGQESRFDTWVDHDRCGIISVFKKATSHSSDDRVATPGYCTAKTGDIPIECAILKKPGNCRKPAEPDWATYTPAKALYCQDGTNGSQDGCTTIDVMCDGESCVIPREMPGYTCP